MSSWDVVTLAECVDLLAGFAFKSSGFLPTADGGVPLVKGENLSQGRILWSQSRYWPEREYDTYAKYQLRAGDVVVAMDRPWVPAGLKWSVIGDTDPKALLVQRCARLRTRSPKLLQSYLRYVIGGGLFEEYIRPITTGVNVPHISGAQILAFRFALPSINEQQRIVDVLTPYEELIENCARRIQLLEDAARILYGEWFISFRYPGHEKVPLVETLLGRIPKGWRVERLDTSARVHRGRSYRSTDLAHDGGVPFVNLKCIDRDGGFRRGGIKRFVGSAPESHSVRTGDIVLAVTDMTQEVSARPTARSGPAGSVRGFGDCEWDQATAAWRAAAQAGGSSSPRRWLGQPPASFWKTSVRYASGSMSASMQVESTV